MEEEQVDSGHSFQEGVVTRLAAQKKDPMRVSIFLNEAFAFGVHLDVVAKFGLHKGQKLDVEVQRRIVQAELERAAFSKALDYLSYRARTEYEVRQKLRQRGYEEAVIDPILHRLAKNGYLDDASFAKSYVQGRLRNKKYGPQRLRIELARRGVDRSIIDVVVADVTEHVDLLELARGHAHKRWVRLAREANPYKRRKKLSDYLQRLGFSFDIIRQVFDELEAEE